MENSESVRIETACAGADSGVQLSVLCRDLSNAGVKIPMPGEYSAITVDEADKYVDVVGSSTPVHGGGDCERFTFRKSECHAFLKDSGRVFDTSGLPLFKFYFLSSSHCYSFLW